MKITLIFLLAVATIYAYADSMPSNSMVIRGRAARDLMNAITFTTGQKAPTEKQLRTAGQRYTSAKGTVVCVKGECRIVISKENLK